MPDERRQCTEDSLEDSFEDSRILYLSL